MKYKPGTYVVPLEVSPEEWEHAPYYSIEMDPYIGQVGKAVSQSHSDKNVYRVIFELSAYDKTFWYREHWLRLATEEEIRNYKFIKNIRRM